VKMVPVAWDETRFLAGDIDDYVVVARRKGKDWYIGAMGNEKPHDLKISLSFLGAGKFNAKLWEDGTTPTALRESERVVTATDVLELKLAPSGGAAVRIR
jgi:alpha-glucosidase